MKQLKFSIMKKLPYEGGGAMVKDLTPYHGS
jgi:hypothetical protein